MPFVAETASPYHQTAIASDGEASSPIVSGSKSYLDLNLVSHDFIDRNNPRHKVWNSNHSRNYNQQNTDIGITHLKEVWQSAGGEMTGLLGGSVGYDRNSMCKDSFYVTGNAELSHKVLPSVNVGIGAQVGAVTGYTKSIAPAGQVYARIEKEFGKEIGEIRSVFLQVGLIPKYNSKHVSTPATATVRIGISF